MRSEQPYQEALLVVPRLRVQGANAISSPMTWGFPSMTAFLGLMDALGRRLPEGSRLEFRGVGVVCHAFEAQVSVGEHARTFRLSRNPHNRNGEPSPIVEEGRIHLDITLIFLVNLATADAAESARQQLADQVGQLIAEMRVAGGTVMPVASGIVGRAARPRLRVLPDGEEGRRGMFRRMRLSWLPGFVLVSRDDLLREHLTTLRRTNPGATRLDAWLDLSRINERAVRIATHESEVGEGVTWEREERTGWLVPIPVGFAALSKLYASGEVGNARDTTTPFRFVEAVYSMGQWVSPHRLTDANDLLWYRAYDEAAGVYECRNDFALPSAG